MPFKRKGSPYYYCYVSGVRISLKTRSLEDARKAEAKLKHEHWEQKRLGVKPKKSWPETIERWVHERADKRSLASDLHRLRKLDPYFVPVGDINEITRDFVHGIMSLWGVDLANPTPQNSSANRYVALISAILNAAEREWEWGNRAPKLRMYPEPEGRDRWLTVEEWRRLEKELPVHLRGPATFALCTGLRLSSVFQMTWSQVNLTEHWMSFSGSANKRGNVIPLNSSAMSILLAIHKAPIRDIKYVFTYRGRHLQHYGKAWYKALARARLGGNDANILVWDGSRAPVLDRTPAQQHRGDSVSWHTLRHTFATWLRHGGAPDWAIDALGGWSRAATRERYSHAAVEPLRQYAAIIDRVLAGTSEKERTG